MGVLDPYENQFVALKLQLVRSGVNAYFYGRFLVVLRFHNLYEYQTFEMDLIGLAGSDTTVSRMKLNEFRNRQSTGLSTVVTPISLAAGAGSRTTCAGTNGFHPFFLTAPRDRANTISKQQLTVKHFSVAFLSL